MPAEKKPSDTLVQEKDHAACGVGLIAPLPKEGKAVEGTHQLVQEGLDILQQFEYRAGYNVVTEESDGCGIKLTGLSVNFFTKKITGGEFVGDLANVQLKEDGFAIGQFFLPTDEESQWAAKALIEECAKEHGLTVSAWRNLDVAVDPSCLSPNAAQKKPALWQALILPQIESSSEKTIEPLVLKMSLSLGYSCKEKNIALHIVSLSSECIIYKGMLRTNQMAAFYRDLTDPEFTAKAVIVHSRFATNTDPQWSNAQPCVYFIAHNGEFNSAPANANEMASELTARKFKGIIPDQRLSDSMQFDADLANQMAIHQIPLAEAMMRLMAPNPANYGLETQEMLRYWGLQRTPYNGPAFVVASSNGYHIAKLDGMGLRPSRYAVVEKNGTQFFYAASDDFVINTKEQKVITKGHLEPGGMRMLTPQGELLDTQAILTRISAQYNQNTSYYFHNKIKQHVANHLGPDESKSLLHEFPTGLELQRRLYSSGWDNEAEEQVLRFMAENGIERTGAMGDDTNILHTQSMPPHLSYFLHQLFAQVSNPPIDSKNERVNFSLYTVLGAAAGSSTQTKQLELDSPILGVCQLHALEHHQDTLLNVKVIHLTIPLPAMETASLSFAKDVLTEAILNLFKQVEKLMQQPGGIIVLTDREASAQSLAIPDIVAVAAVRRYLELKHRDRDFSILVDSYQIHGPHQAAVLFAFGAKAVYPRGAYAKIHELYPENTDSYCKNYKEAQEKCLLKTMGKKGITDVRNYINGQMMASLGMDLSEDGSSLLVSPGLASIFPKIYAPMKGVNLGHVAYALLNRHQQAYHPDNDLALLPRSGHYMPEKNGVVHGFGPVVVNAMTTFIKQERVRDTSKLLDEILKRKGYDEPINNPSIFSLEQGFLDPRQKNPQGFYTPEYLEKFRASAAFKRFLDAVDRYRRESPVYLRDYFILKAKTATPSSQPLQSQKDIRQLLYGGSISQGALTRPAHTTLVQGLNAIGANSASGEGGESPLDLHSRLRTARSKQFASGRFGISAEQILNADEIEIKIAQGAKPGEGGELPGRKVTIEYAAQRGGMKTDFFSPPPHHDIYSIEDLEQLIHDIKSVNPRVLVTVKLVASPGIGTIAAGVVKAGADKINIASNSGGTGAAQQSSIKHTGMPSELGLIEVHTSLKKVKLRDSVKLCVSGGIRTVDEILTLAVLGADSFELGTMAMLGLGCMMLRTCHSYCPGVATNAHLFKGEQINIERYFVNLAASIQSRLHELGFSHLSELIDQHEILQWIGDHTMALYDFSLLTTNTCPNRALTTEESERLSRHRESILQRPKEDILLKELTAWMTEKKSETLVTDPIVLTTADRSFGARITGQTVGFLRENSRFRLHLNTVGTAGQSFAFVTSDGMVINHQGSVQDGCAKSMTGGKLILRPAIQSEESETHTIAGNAVLYGASGGKVYINGAAGTRFGVLMKGAQVVVNQVGNFAFEYMTSGTGMVLMDAGTGIGTGAMGGILFVHDRQGLSTGEAVRIASAEESQHYANAIETMLKEHVHQTGSLVATKLLAQAQFTMHFKVLIPKAMDKINELTDLIDIIHIYQLRKVSLTVGMEVWLTQKIVAVLTSRSSSVDSINQLRHLLTHMSFELFSSQSKAKIFSALPLQVKSEQFDLPPMSFHLQSDSKPAVENPVQNRLATLSGAPDYLLLEPLQHIDAYIKQLSHNAEGCSGCRSQSCAGSEQLDTGCPAGKGINTINALLKKIGPISETGLLTTQQWTYLRQAFEVQIQETPFIAYTGAACPAPCQDACTETIPDEAKGQMRGKPIGEAVHIKDIEFYLFQIARSLGWLSGKKQWSQIEITRIFGEVAAKQTYEQAMQIFKPPFRMPGPGKASNKELIIVGSGPAAMQIAYRALLDGVRVRMYEKSDKPGGLLADGIPHHKFDKVYLQEDFERLKAMGLQLYLQAEVFYDDTTRQYRLKDDTQTVIASADNDNQFLALCIGAGEPKNLPNLLLAPLNATQKTQVVQAIDFLKAANDLANQLRSSPSFSVDEHDALIKKIFGSMDPRHKKIVVIGGGDTAQDAIRWLARHETLKELLALTRGPKPTQRAILDGYPSPSRGLTSENKLKHAEMEYIHGTEHYLSDPVQLSTNPQNNTLRLKIKVSTFKYANELLGDAEAKPLFESLPREMRVINPDSIKLRTIEDIDMIVCALGFKGHADNPLLAFKEQHELKRVFVAGDATGTGIIVAAQNNANKVYSQLAAAMGIVKSKLAALMPFFNNERKLEALPVTPSTPSPAAEISRIFPNALGL